MITLTAWAKENIVWWLDITKEECVLSMATAPIWNSIRLATDASDLLWGSVLAGQEVSYEWSQGEICHTIAHKEWMAFEYTIWSNLAFLTGRLVTWHVDNQNARLAFINQGTVNDGWLCKRVVNLLLLLQEYSVLVVPVYVRSLHHLHADFLSRRKVIPDWHLLTYLVQNLFLMCGMPDIDLMATHSSAQLPLYYAPTQDEEALATDSMVQDWDKFTNNFVFPPPVMMELVLNRIHQCKTTTSFLVVSPWKPRATWFPKVSALVNFSSAQIPSQSRNSGGSGSVFIVFPAHPLAWR